MLPSIGQREKRDSLFGGITTIAFGQKKTAVLTGIFIKDRPRYHAFIDPRFLRPSVGSFEYVSVIAEGRLRHTSNLANMFEAAML